MLALTVGELKDWTWSSMLYFHRYTSGTYWKFTMPDGQYFLLNTETNEKITKQDWLDAKMSKPRQRVSAVIGRDLSYISTKVRIISDLHLIRVLYTFRKCGYHLASNRRIMDLKGSPYIYVSIKGAIGKGVCPEWFEDSPNREVFIP